MHCLMIALTFITTALVGAAIDVLCIHYWTRKNRREEVMMRKDVA